MHSYRGAEADRHWMELAIELSRQCPPSDSAFAVGAVIIDADGAELARGYSRETGRDHAEESALSKLGPDPRLTGATLYSTLEPCSTRASRPDSCARLTIKAGIARVVIAWREPPIFVQRCEGVELLRAAGITVDLLPEFEAAAKEPNAHLGL
jgi:pyrimidine deaminase RibD-like protein